MSASNETPRVLICMADNGQDPTECAVPWKYFLNAGFVVEFATEKGAVPSADQLLVKGSLFKSVLGPKQTWTDVYLQMTQSDTFKSPKSWSADGFSLLQYDLVLLPGGHDKPIKQYLESQTLHELLKQYWPLTRRVSTDSSSYRRVVGAICHGVLVLAFAGLLQDVETTTLPQWLEGTAQTIGSLWGRGQYYRTYPERWTYEDVQRTQKDPAAQYKRGPIGPSAFAHTDPTYAYVSARWPGDADLFAERLIEEVRNARKEGNSDAGL
ncbi:class I glutamine amidotransferase-like protein [Auriculariales sp. MPI-PUGE-AT-0066]|nr:class I glutamine amidotransferase-like protein [Auriculariales sp. MPI-PUGE-AT-0066]